MDVQYFERLYDLCTTFYGLSFSAVQIAILPTSVPTGQPNNIVIYFICRLCLPMPGADSRPAADETHNSQMKLRGSMPFDGIVWYLHLILSRLEAMKPINWYIYSSCAIYERVPFGWKSHSIFVCMWCTNTHTHTHPRHTNWSRYFLLFCDFHSYRFISSGDNDHHHRHHRHCSSTLHSYVLVNNKKEPHVFFPISDIYRSTPVDILNRTHCRVHRILSSFFFSSGGCGRGKTYLVWLWHSTKMLSSILIFHFTKKEKYKFISNSMWHYDTIWFSIHDNDNGSDMRSAPVSLSFLCTFKSKSERSVGISLFALHLVSVYLNNKCDFHRLHVWSVHRMRCRAQTRLYIYLHI